MPAIKRIPLILVLLTLLGTAVLVWPVSALPPRPVLTPPPPPATAVSPVGGFIVLQATAATAVTTPLWTHVQWQDPAGEWHEVDGWRGAFDNDLTVTWWVAPEDLNTGPFRWLVYASPQSDKVTAVSEPFSLPSVPNQTTIVTLSIP